VRSVGVVTGAGISAESGIPTYRGAGGLYDDPEEGERTVEALSGSTLAADPDRTWRAIASLARAARGARPNAAHEALVAIERKLTRFVLLTQNVDGLHRLAGSRNVIDIHGDTFATRCMLCDAPGRLDDLTGLESAPACRACPGILRPDVVLFGELLPLAKVRRIQEEFHRDPPDLVMAIGTSALFPYIVEPVVAARASGRLTLEINPEPTVLSPIVDVALRGRASELLPELSQLIG
jgi:NAD-dependent deacetylase